MKALTVDVIRGENRIGENLIEISKGNTKLLLECGIPLLKTEHGAIAERKVLSTHYQGVIVTHYHPDHCGLLKKKISADGIYMGKSTRDILLCRGEICAENLEKIRVMKDGERFLIGDIRIKPYLCDHSAYDSYMIELSVGNERVLYTGDFRANGRKSFSSLLSRLPKKVDLLITEGTNLRRGQSLQTEKDIEEKATQLFGDKGKVFILQSSLNVERTVTFYRAAKRTGRIFLETLQSAENCALLPNIPSPVRFSDCYTYLAVGVDAERRAELRDKYGKKLKSKYSVAQKKNVVMQVHTGMLGYFRALSRLCDLSDSVLVYSMWSGYKKEIAPFLQGVAQLGIKVIDLHVSGHADAATIELLEKRVNPKRVLIVHTEG